MMHEIKKVFTDISEGFEHPDFGWIDAEEYDFNVTILYDNDNVVVIIDDLDGKELLTGGEAIEFLIQTNLRDRAE